MFHLILFLVFGVVCVFGAVNLLAQSHPINSALSLIVVMGSLAVLYLLLGAEFVAAIQLIVYAGAIMVLFVFVIMLLNAGEEERIRSARIATFLGLPAVVVIGGIVVYALLVRGPAQTLVSIGSEYGSPAAIGRLLFRDFLLPFEVTSILILIAIMGAVLLAQPGRRVETAAERERRERVEHERELLPVGPSEPLTTSVEPGRRI